MIVLDAASYAAWYNIAFIFILLATGVTIWLHNFQSRLREIAINAILLLWLLHAILLASHHWLGWPDIH